MHCRPTGAEAAGPIFVRLQRSNCEEEVVACEDGGGWAHRAVASSSLATARCISQCWSSSASIAVWHTDAVSAAAWHSVHLSPPPPAIQPVFSLRA